MKDVDAAVARQYEELQWFDFEVGYWKESSYANAYAMSRPLG